MIFEWDDHNRNHIALHRITPEEAEEVLTNEPLDMEEQIVDGEERIVQIGETFAGRILVIVSTWRSTNSTWDVLVRIVTGWDAPQADKQWYLDQRIRKWPS